RGEPRAGRLAVGLVARALGQQPLDLRPRALALARVRVEARPERALLLFQADALPAQLVASALERFGQVPHARLLAAGVDERVLRGLDDLLGRRAGAIELAQPVLGGAQLLLRAAALVGEPAHVAREALVLRIRVGQARREPVGVLRGRDGA